MALSRAQDRRQGPATLIWISSKIPHHHFDSHLLHGNAFCCDAMKKNDTPSEGCIQSYNTRYQARTVHPIMEPFSTAFILVGVTGDKHG